MLFYEKRERRHTFPIIIFVVFSYESNERVKRTIEIRIIFLTVVKCLSVPRNRLNFNGKRLRDNVQDPSVFFSGNVPLRRSPATAGSSAARRCGNGLAWLSPHPAVYAEAQDVLRPACTLVIQRFHSPNSEALNCRLSPAFTMRFCRGHWREALPQRAAERQAA